MKILLYIYTNPYDKSWCVDHLRSFSFLLPSFENAAIVVDGCSESSRLGEDILVCLYHLLSHVPFVLH